MTANQIGIQNLLARILASGPYKQAMIIHNRVKVWDRQNNMIDLGTLGQVTLSLFKKPVNPDLLDR